MIKHHFKGMTFGLVACALVILSTLFMIARLSSAQAAGAVPGGNISNPVVRAIDIAKPAIVRIFTTIDGQVTVHITTTQSATFPLNGGNYKLEFSGTGAFISTHGDILTADHVVNPPHDSSLDEALYEAASQDVATYINQNFNATTPYSAQDALSLMANGNFQTTTHYGQTSSAVYLSTDYTGPLLQTDLKKLAPNVWQRVDKIEQQSPTDEHDVALIHVNMTDTPSIQLGDSSGVAQQDELTIIGFPGNADINSKNDPTQLLTSSVNKIYVSALKENDMHAPLIEVGGNVEHGDSGGPALDNNGNIVGIVSSYSSAADYPLGTSFLQASSSAQTLLLNQGLDTKPGPFEQAWKQAFTDYTSTAPGHWHKAQQEFQNLSIHYDSFDAVTPYLSYAQNQASHEQLPTHTTSSSINYIAWFIGIASFIFLVLITLGCLLFFTSKRYKKPLSTPIGSSIPSTWPYPTGNIPSNMPTYAFAEQPPQRPSGAMMPSQPLTQQNGAMPPQTAFASSQQNFPLTSPATTPPLPAPPLVPVMWQQEPYKSANSPTPSPLEGKRRPFPDPITPPPPTPFEEWQKSYQLPAPYVSSPAWDADAKEVETPTAKHAAFRRQKMVPDHMPDANAKP